MAYCQNCGTGIGSAGNYCPNCGAALSSVNNTAYTFQNGNSNTMKTAATVAGAAVGVSLLSNLFHRRHRPPMHGPMHGMSHGGPGMMGRGPGRR